MSVVLLLSLLGCASIIVSSLTISIGLKKMSSLGDIEPDSTNTSKVSVIIPACNEEEHIRQSILSLMNQDYTNTEIIIVNDRSTDNTAQVLQGLKANFPELILHEIVELTPGWMGKSHALSKGAARASGDYLVFTDADVLFEKTTLARAVSCMSRYRLDHLTLLFRSISSGWLLNCLVLDSLLGLLFVFRPWRLKKREVRGFIGVGAFNMVKRSVYQRVGGHSQIKMHPVDDMMLGKLIKHNGYRQDCLFGYDFIHVPWYDSVAAMVKGLEKNIFAVIHYRFTLLPVLLLSIVVPTILPVWGLFSVNFNIVFISALTCLIRLTSYYRGLQLLKLPISFLPGCLCTPYISCYIILRSAALVYLRRGIVWRGQYYSLSDLKKTDPLFF